MFLCNVAVDTDGRETGRTYSGMKFTYGPQIQFRSSKGTKTLNFRDLTSWQDTIGILSPSGNDFPNRDVRTNKNNGEFCLRWIMMVKNDTYTITGTTLYTTTDEAEYYLFKQQQTTNNVTVPRDTYSNVTISIAPEIIRKNDTLYTKNISVVWDRVDTDVEAESSLFSDIYDANHNKINKVRGYYDLDPGDSVATIGNGGKSVTICMDEYDRIGKEQPIRFYRFEYYTRRWVFDWFNSHYEYDGPFVTNTGTDSGKKARADKAACEAYINFQNLVDKIGESAASQCRLFDAKVDLSFTGRIATAQLSANEGHLIGDVCLQRKARGSNTWVDILNVYESKNIQQAGGTNFWKISNNWSEFTVQLDNLNLDKYTLDQVNYNDELRLKIDLEYKSLTEECFVELKNAKVNITYGLDI